MHQTQLQRRHDRQKLYRSRAKYIIEVTPQRNFFVFIGQLMTALTEQCTLNAGLIRKVEKTILGVLASWGDFSMYVNLYKEIAQKVGKATNQVVYLDIKRR